SRTAITTGYSTSSATSSGERPRIRRAFRSSQRIALVAPLVQERDEGGLEVPPARAADHLLERPRRAGEQALPVGEHYHLAGVPLGLLHHVRGVHDGRAGGGQPQHELPHP